MLVGDHRLMNTDDIRLRRFQARVAAPIDYAARRLTSLFLVPAALLGVVGTILAEAAGLRHDVAIIVGFGLFLAGTAMGTMLAWRIQRHVLR